MALIILGLTQGLVSPDPAPLPAACTARAAGLPRHRVTPLSTTKLLRCSPPPQTSALLVTCHTVDGARIAPHPCPGGQVRKDLLFLSSVVLKGHAPPFQSKAPQTCLFAHCPPTEHLANVLVCLLFSLLPAAKRLSDPSFCPPLQFTPAVQQENTRQHICVHSSGQHRHSARIAHTRHHPGLCGVSQPPHISLLLHFSLRY